MYAILIGIHYTVTHERVVWLLVPRRGRRLTVARRAPPRNRSRAAARRRVRESTPVQNAAEAAPRAYSSAAAIWASASTVRQFLVVAAVPSFRSNQALFSLVRP